MMNARVATPASPRTRAHQSSAVFTCVLHGYVSARMMSARSLSAATLEAVQRSAGTIYLLRVVVVVQLLHQRLLG